MSYKIPITLEDLLLLGRFTNKEKEAIYREVTRATLKMKQIEHFNLTRIVARPKFKWW